MYEWTDSGMKLLQTINRIIKLSGGMAIYSREVELENMRNQFSTEAMLLKNTIRTLKYSVK